jgi:hypothetical protein
MSNGAPRGTGHKSNPYSWQAENRHEQEEQDDLKPQNPLNYHRGELYE